MPTWLDIIALSIVEGITEFLPISSTGHMIIAEKLLNIPKSDELDAFLVIVQGGAILAVITVFWKLFWGWLKAWVALFTKSPAEANPGHKAARSQSLFVASAVIPFGLLGFLLHKQISALFDVKVVAAALITGAILILFSEYVLAKRVSKEKTTDSLTLLDALLLGCGQCLALWPGFSRSAATIIAGRARGYSQGAAAELSFIIGLPTLAGAASYEMIQKASLLTGDWILFLSVGIVVAWVVAYLFVKGFILFLKKYSMAVFAYYRLVVGGLLLFFFGNS
jgi:undecaprenyl-diphosphatase